MSTPQPWSTRPKIDELKLTDIFMRRVLSGTLNQEIPFSDITTFMNGSATEYISEESDLPALSGGFHKLEQGKNYIFLEAMTIANPILFPAGWTGIICRQVFNTDIIEYTGTATMFQTLNIDGTIASVADAGGGAITVTTGAPHGLANGDFVNITGTTSYNAERLVISNVTASTYDVQIAFVADETGAFDTGYNSIRFFNFNPQNAATANWLDLTSSQSPNTALIFSISASVAFLSPGIIRKAPTIVFDTSFFGFFTEGLTLEDCDIVAFTQCEFFSFPGASTTARALILTGAATRRITSLNCAFTMGDADQRPVRIDPSITAANEILFLISPDNDVADEYFDTSAGGLDETDPQVIAENNGTRKNSQTISESRTNGMLEVDGSGGVDVPIVDIAPVAGDWIEDPSTERFSVDTTTGLATYNGTKPVTVMIKYSLSASQTSGSAQTVDIDLHINGIIQTKSTITIITAGVGSPISGVYNGANFLINPGDTFQLFKDNTTNTNNTDITNATMLINLD